MSSIGSAARSFIDRCRISHPESTKLARQVLQGWALGLPEEDTDALLNGKAGTPIRWNLARAGWRKGVKLGRGAVIVVELDPHLEVTSSAV